MNKKIILLLSVLCSYGLAQADDFTLVRRANRRFNAAMVRDGATDRCVRQELAEQPTNGDEWLYPDFRGSYGKGLKQLATGFVDPAAYESLLFALATGKSSDFDKILMGTADPVMNRRLVSPQAALGFNLGGADSWIHSIAAPPAVASAEKAGEMVELYWMALLRDQLFDDYTGAVVTRAVEDMNALSDFKGPKNGAGMVTAGTLFRSNVDGATIGNYISQFLLQTVNFSDTDFFQLYSTPDTDLFMATLANWANIQTGANPLEGPITFNAPQYITNIRDMANFVHADPPQLPYLFALLILIGWVKDATGGNAVLDPNNPYINNPTQESFAEFFKPQAAALVSQAVDMALHAAWYQKWMVHRTLRPEYFGWLVHNQRLFNANPATGFDSGLHADVTGSRVVNEGAAGAAIANNIFLFNANLIGGPGTYLLPQAFPEGSPLHPTYPAGHATVGGAAVTILKALFNEDFEIPQAGAGIRAKVVDPGDATMLMNYAGAALTIGNELNKLAANIAYGRNMAGVHYRSDAEASLRLGEAVAISLLEDWAYTMNIDFKGFSLTKFDGTKITVGAKKVMPGLPR